VRRRGGPAWAVAVDVVRSGRSSGSWLISIVVVLVLLAAVIAAVGHSVLPWLIYPAL
jgi:hypothetical protein